LQVMTARELAPSWHVRILSTMSEEEWRPRT
jgi:hypothetical protein